MNDNLFFDAPPPCGENIDTIAPDDERWVEASKVGEYDPRRHDFAWNADFTYFIPLPLKWWDDESYIAYQCGDMSDTEREPEPIPDTEPEVRVNPILPPPLVLVVEDDEDDDIPF